MSSQFSSRNAVEMLHVDEYWNTMFRKALGESWSPKDMIITKPWSDVRAGFRYLFDNAVMSLKRCRLVPARRKPPPSSDKVLWSPKAHCANARPMACLIAI